MHSVSAVTPVENCSSYSFAVTQHKCSVALVLANAIPTIHEFIQVCSEPTDMQCSTGLGKMHSPLFSAALQNRFTACIVSLQ